MKIFKIELKQNKKMCFLFCLNTFRTRKGFYNPKLEKNSL